MKSKPSKPAAKPASAVPLEIVPKAEDQLASAVHQVRELRDLIHAKSRDLVYDVVALGVYLLKVRDLHCQERKRTDLASGGQCAASDDDPTFYQFIEANFMPQNVSDETERRNRLAAILRRFRRYMNAARNAGLTGDHTLEDVQRLREKHALDDRNLTDLYKPLALPEATPQKPPPKRNLCAEVSASLAQDIDNLIRLRDDTDPDLFEANTTLLQSALEKYTGGEWVMVGTDNHGAHAEVHQNGSRKAAMSAKRKTSKSAKLTKGRGRK